MNSLPLNIIKVLINRNNIYRQLTESYATHSLPGFSKMSVHINPKWQTVPWNRIVFIPSEQFLLCYVLALPHQSILEEIAWETFMIVVLISTLRTLLGCSVKCQGWKIVVSSFSTKDNGNLLKNSWLLSNILTQVI